MSHRGHQPTVSHQEVQGLLELNTFRPFLAFFQAAGTTLKFNVCVCPVQTCPYHNLRPPTVLSIPGYSLSRWLADLHFQFSNRK